MELTTQKKQVQGVEVIEASKPLQIKKTLMELLYVPNEALKPKIISEIVAFYKRKSVSPEDKITIFVALRNGTKVGFVFCQIDQDYRSYGMRCPTFGWLHAQNFEACEALMGECEKFVRANKLKKLRGPINYPKKVGGIGFQIEGFAAPMMSGVAFNDPGSNVLAYLEALGYKPDAKYSCVDAFVKKWEKGKELDENIMTRFLSLDEIKALKEQILGLAKQSFYAVLADAAGGKDRFEEIMEMFYQASKEVKIVNPDFDPQTYADMPGFLDTWNAADLEKIVPTSIFAFDRSSGELVGILMAQPNMYQLWSGEPLTHMNVDTVIIKKEYLGKQRSGDKGYFSSFFPVKNSFRSPKTNLKKIIFKFFSFFFLHSRTSRKER